MKSPQFIAYLVFIFILIFALLCCTSALEAGIVASQDQLEAIVDEYLTEQEGVLSTLVQVDIDGRKPMRSAKGFFDISKKAPIKGNEQFIIGSITKVFTATMVHQLVEEKKVLLDKPLIDYLPSEWAAVLGKVEHGRVITVGQALCHRSGLFDIAASGAFFRKIFADLSRRWTPLEVVNQIPEGGKPMFEPGTSFAYSSSNYLFLGALVEYVTNSPYRVALQERILSKVKLKNTFISEGPFGSNKKGISHGYLKMGGKSYDGQDFDSGFAWSAGGIISTTDDLNRFIKALVSGRLFKSKQTFQQMCSLSEDNDYYGLGIEVFNENTDDLYYCHRGSFGNTSSIMCYFPKKNTAISLCHNFDGTADRLQTHALAELIVEKLSF
jgi:CubicO group peptidase (beta-lactamase class C family)